MAERVSEIQATQHKLEQELESLATELNQPPPSPSAPIAASLSSDAARHADIPYLLGPLAITIDWTAIGKSHLKQIICERKASNTLRTFFEVILDRFGSETLGRLVAIRANRAPLLSRQPQTEFLNVKQGVCYQHQQIGASGWHVLTHSSTSEKMAIIRQVARALRFPSGGITVEEVDMKREIENLLNLTPRS